MKDFVEICFINQAEVRGSIVLIYYERPPKFGGALKRRDLGAFKGTSLFGYVVWSRYLFFIQKKKKNTNLYD